MTELPLIARHDLVAALDRAAGRRVAIVSAPAGSGKTSLLRAWAEGSVPYRIAFVTVPRDQRDGQLFWLTVLGALAGEATPTPGFNGPAMVERVRAELDADPSPLMLMIDDLHELTAPEALEQLGDLLTRLPRHVHAILATRRDLRLRLHQLRLAGELAEIRAADLCFTERETRELLAASGIVLSDEAITLLHQRTEGWAAGLRLAAISLAGHPDPDRFVTEFCGSNRTVAEYLLAEMLERQPDHIRNLLLRTCLPDKVNGELADLLAGRPGSEQILLELEDANAFVVSVNAERTWFRYHHLFSGLLRLEARRTMPEEIPALHRKAARWFADRGYAAEAVRHLQAAGDWSEAALLLADNSFSMTLDGQAETIRALLRAFPEAVAEKHPELAVVHAADDLARGRLDEAGARLAFARVHAETTPPQRRRRHRIAIASLDLVLARQQGHYADVIEQVNALATPVIDEANADVCLSRDLRAQALLNLGTAEAWSLRLHDSERHLQEGAALARDIGRPYLEVGCLAQLGFASKAGSFDAARLRCEEAIALAGVHGWAAEPVIVPALATLAGTLTWMGRFDDGERRHRQAERAARAGVDPAMQLLLRLVAGMIHAGRGRHREALEEFEAAQRVQGRMVGEHALTPQVIGWVIATQARLGMLDQARASIAVASRGCGEIHNAAAVISLAEGDPAGAHKALQPVLDGTAPVIHDFTLVESLLLDALASREHGDQAAANESVERALGIAEPDRLILPFAMTGARRLVEALPRTRHRALASDILDGFPAPPEDSNVLSPSELRVLRHLPTNLTRPEIASELSVSLNTVNTHIRNIYAKLGARDRSAAVERARELRLLSPGRNR